VAKVHVLVVPRAHVTNLVNARPQDEELLGHLMRAASEVARKLGIVETGYRLAMNQGVNAGQIVEHLHLHVLGGQKLYPLGEIATGTEG
jgi:histidine triad (HIT) family protein